MHSTSQETQKRYSRYLQSREPVSDFFVTVWEHMDKKGLLSGLDDSETLEHVAATAEKILSQSKTSHSVS